MHEVLLHLEAPVATEVATDGAGRRGRRVGRADHRDHAGGPRRVHPAVARDFEQSGKNWLESAILFDSGFVHRTRFDYVVCVTAPQEVRLQRIMQRDQISRQKAEEWINAQLPQADVVLQSDFEIRNDGKEDLNLQIDRLLNQVK